MDETGWRVGGQSAWLHVWVSEQATCYVVAPQRSADVLEEVIGLDWDGPLVHDGYSSYDRFRSAIPQQCLGHVLRRARELLATAVGGARPSLVASQTKIAPAAAKPLRGSRSRSKANLSVV